jgi:hypothetical protein
VSFAKIKRQVTYFQYKMIQNTYFHSERERYGHRKKDQTKARLEYNIANI